MCKVLSGILQPLAGEKPSPLMLEALAYDVKHLLSGLRKLRRDWRYLASQKTESPSQMWPSVAMQYDERLRELLELLDAGHEALKDEFMPFEEENKLEGLLFDVPDLQKEDKERHELEMELDRRRKLAFQDPLVRLQIS